MQDQLGLTEVQREQILAHRHIKLVSLARLLQDRRELQLKLQVPHLHNSALPWQLLCSASASGVCTESDGGTVMHVEVVGQLRCRPEAGLRQGCG